MGTTEEEKEEEDDDDDNVDGEGVRDTTSGLRRKKEREKQRVVTWVATDFSRALRSEGLLGNFGSSCFQSKLKFEFFELKFEFKLKLVEAIETSSRSSPHSSSNLTCQQELCFVREGVTRGADAGADGLALANVDAKALPSMGCLAALAKRAGEGDDVPNKDSHAHIAERAIVVEVEVEDTASATGRRVLLPVRGDESPATTIAEVFLWFVLVDDDILRVLIVIISLRLIADDGEMAEGGIYLFSG
mmetsp:Transcript_33187/g.67881  ORF Transcript_33187/g.67881 Transcript_33187/m.67881 type:complete len:246 (+) Transcript_33187:52-789(+)